MHDEATTMLYLQIKYWKATSIQRTGRDLKFLSLLPNKSKDDFFMDSPESAHVATGHFVQWNIRWAIQ